MKTKRFHNKLNSFYFLKQEESNKQLIIVSIIKFWCK